MKSRYAFFLTALVTLMGCEQFLDIDPPKTSLVSETVFNTDATAIAAMNAVYARMSVESNRYVGGETSVTYLTGMTSDELNFIAGDDLFRQFNVNSIQASNLIVLYPWSSLYQDIYAANAVLEGVENSPGISSEVKTRLAGEAKFLRALCYFYLVNLYDDVPLVLVTDYRKNSLVTRDDADLVYDQIISDLKDAQLVLADSYTGSTRIRPIRHAATALLARVYLYLEDWENAELEATKIIDNPLFVLPADLNTVFLKTSQEAIWQLESIRPGLGTLDGFDFVFTGSTRNVTLSEDLLAAFESGDARQTAWTKVTVVDGVPYDHVFKYKYRGLPAGMTLNNEYLTVLRLAEVYLIRAEARTEQDDFTGAQEDVNIIRDRAELSDTPANTKADLLAAIEQERRIEMMCEWGHRWLDLKRTGRADAVLGAIKANWDATDVLFPIPQSERIANPNLGEQNPGY